MILITGAGGFIGQALCRSLPDGSYRAVSHRSVSEPDLLDGVDCVVHAGRHPKLGQTDYVLGHDVEIIVAERCAERNLPLISLGTRSVYGGTGGSMSEQSQTAPNNAYGEQKLAVENALLDRLGENLTRLRLSNIFGFEPGRRTFFGLMLTRLGDSNKIVFDMSPFAQRDFLPVEQAAIAITALARDPPGGIVNIGSGIGTATGKLALAVIEGFGQGHLIIEHAHAQDPVILDVSRMRQLTGLHPQAAQIIEAARNAGRQLRLLSHSFG